MCSTKIVEDDSTAAASPLSHFAMFPPAPRAPPSVQLAGMFLLCDLQGGHYQDEYVLTDPVVMSSNNSKRFGATDLGSEGINNFAFCSSQVQLFLSDYMDEAVTSAYFLENSLSCQHIHESYDWN